MTRYSKLLFLIICILSIYLFGQTSDTSEVKKENTAVKKERKDKYFTVQQKLWEQNRKMDKILKDTVK